MARPTLWISYAGAVQILGHSNVVSTQRYSRIVDDLVQREAERIEAQGVANGLARTGEIG
jgi:phage gp37-like protein